MKRLRQAISALLRLEHGITGLETAIILIAFVVVGSVFAYTVLSAGLFATEKGREAVHSGMGEVRSTIVTRGGMIGYKGSVDTTGNKTGDTDAVVKLDVTVGSALQSGRDEQQPHNQRSLKQPATRTVEAHVANILGKLGATSRKDAMRTAVERGYVKSQDASLAG